LKALRVVSGVCVLFVALGYGHLLAHHLMHSTAGERGAAFWAIFLTTLLAGVFAVVGGVLLLMPPKR
jgi:formate/nitrite transporter FocA (FNT family)